ncbi:orotidine-5'-phosphate decarboxylase [Oleidesulfovibrio sp.]|uniref:orotidine-5'-phosphate decarboxylase n=1 Tax=Oleidesulfovibrio sp. TaxID=2909707 RepID=UPI003A86ED18
MAELVVALDYPESESALAMAEKLKGTVRWVKVGLELYTATGPSILQRLKDMGFMVFLDLKFFDIPNTVRGAVRSSVRAGADMVNIHLLGGGRMAQAAVQGLREGYEGPASPHTPVLLGVTVLTSMSQEDLPPSMNVELPELVTMLAASGSEWGLNGVVCSGYEVESIKARCGKSYICLTPGIRPAAADDDQRRTMTPQEAVRAGADYLVVGRPVTGAEDPAAAAAAILLSMQEA